MSRYILALFRMKVENSAKGTSKGRSPQVGGCERIALPYAFNRADGLQMGLSYVRAKGIAVGGRCRTGESVRLSSTLDLDIRLPSSYPRLPLGRDILVSLPDSPLGSIRSFEWPI